jgi:tRNA A37 threonylcarbamoyladenosine synthetase subunit TsaC/SUA5/YrdC
LGHPIISTSVTTRKGQLIYEPLEIQAIFNAQVDLMLAAGPLNGQPSSIVDLSGDTPEIIREGAGDISMFF